MVIDRPNPGTAQRIAQTARDFEEKVSGHGPESVTVVPSHDALVITLHGALTEAEKVLARDPAGVAQLRDFHERLFASAAGTLRREIERITGVEVREATAEIVSGTGTVMKVFSTGTVVQVFLLADRVETDGWSSDRHEREQ
jgi:uncharacterized protein YbcI